MSPLRLAPVALALFLAALAEAAPARPASPAAPPAAPAKAAPEQPFEWDVPGLESDIEVAGELEAQGVPMRMHTVVSKWQAMDLYRYFGQQFLKAGFYVPPRRDMPKNLPLNINAVDPKHLLVYTVFFRERKDRKTTLYLATSDMKRMRAQDGAFAPEYPGATGLITSDVEAARTMTYRVSAAREDVVRFYRETLAKSGFSEVEPNLFEKGAEQLLVHVSPGKDKDGKVGVAVMLRIRPPEGTATEAAAP